MKKSISVDLIVGLATVLMFRVVDIVFLFILKTATGIEYSGVISIVKIVEKLLVLLSFQFQCQENS